MRTETYIVHFNAVRSGQTDSWRRRAATGAAACPLGSDPFGCKTPIADICPRKPAPDAVMFTVHLTGCRLC